MAFGDVFGKAFGMVGQGLGFVGELPGQAQDAWSDFADFALPGGGGDVARHGQHAVPLPEKS